MHACTPAHSTRAGGCAVCVKYGDTKWIRDSVGCSLELLSLASLGIGNLIHRLG